MPEPPTQPDRTEQLTRLEQLYHDGVLTEDLYRAALAGLGIDSTAVFDLHGQPVEKQINVAGSYYDQRQIMQVEPGASPAALRRAYLSLVAQQTRCLPLSGIDPKAIRDASCAEMQVSAVYTALFTQRLEADGEVKQMRAPQRGDSAARRLSALEVLNREPHLVLLGDPGSGKSTFVNFVALCLAGEALSDADANLAILTAPLPKQGDKKPQPQPWNHGPLLPVRVVLRDLAARGLPRVGRHASSDTLWNFIVAELGGMLKEYARHLKGELMDRGGLILLDGLDEVPDADQRREQVKQAVQGFAAAFPRCRFLVTSRTYAYQRQAWKLEGFTESVLSPFTLQQIEQFIERWYTHISMTRTLDPEDVKGRAVLLKTAIQRNERLAELATRPLLLTLMASLHAWRGGSLPEKREQLYADAVDLLLDQWESPKVVRDAQGKPLVRQSSLAEWLKVDRAVVRTELNHLAFEAHRDQPQRVGTADIPEGRLVSALMNVTRNPDVNPTRLVEYIRDRAGLLAARGEGVYTFPHRTFQEYLAACHLTDHGFPDELADLVRADPGRWREVVLLAGAKAARGAASTVWNLAEALCLHDPPAEGAKVVESDCWGALLAAQTLVENESNRLAKASERNVPKRDRIHQWLLATVTRGWLPPLDGAMAGEALAVFGDERNLDELVSVPAGPFLMGSPDADKLAQDDEKPRHTVTLPTFKIAKYPVTNAHYLRFVEETQRKWRSDDRHCPERANYPAVYVSWHDARAYCEWLTQVWRTGGKIADDETVRLPTEAEWEKAARGKDGRVWPWGNEWDAAKCNTYELGLGRTCTVGTFPAGASPYGCLDMVGNVWEWTMSLWGESLSQPSYKYPYYPHDGRESLEADDDVLRVARGGSFHSPCGGAHCTVRGRLNARYDWDSYGFRIVVAPRAVN